MMLTIPTHVDILADSSSIRISNLPALVIGIIMLAYWARVLRMAMKMRKKTGRAANFVPTEPLGKMLRLLWQPVVWIWIAIPILSGFIRHPPMLIRPIYHSLTISLLGVLLAIGAFLATRICWKRMGKSWRMGIDPAETTPLVVTGPYAYVRHPIYALSSLLMIATIITVPTPLMIFVGIIHVLLLQWEARREERHLINVHGDTYRQYLESVGRFFPNHLRAYHG